MKYQYAPTNRNARLAWLQCELCECGHAIAKVNRWGGHSRNPEKPQDDFIENPTNIGEVLFELWDIEAAATALMPDIVQFLGVELVQKMRAAWEAKAIPPVSDDDPVAVGASGPELRRKCMVCGGAGRVQRQQGDHQIVDGCPACSGSGLMAAERSPGEGQTTEGAE